MRIRWFNRKLDALGRVVIPKEYRKALKMVEGEELELRLTKEGVLVNKANKVCALCGKSIKAKHSEAPALCSSCVEAIKKT